MSETVRARNAKFCTQIQKKCKIGSKGVRKGSRDLLLIFWHPFISRQRSSNNTDVDRAIVSKFGFERDLSNC